MTACAPTTSPTLLVIGDTNAPVYPIEELDLSEIFNRPDSTYVLRVKGDWLTRLHLCDGDLLVIERNRKPPAGELVVGLVGNGEAIVQRYDPAFKGLVVVDAVVGMVRAEGEA